MLFQVAYTCSGLAGLVYQVCWTRLLTLYLGHSIAAASAVVAAFLGGLAVGAAAGGGVAARLTPRRALVVYGVLEVIVAMAAMLLPWELRAFLPLLASAYNDGAGGTLFPALRILACLVMVFVPATALGATFPMAIRWFSADSPNRARSTGLLYALNSAGAAVGAVLAGFVLIPLIGVSGTTLVGVGASVTAAASVALIARRQIADHPVPPPRPSLGSGTQASRVPSPRSTRRSGEQGALESQWLAAGVLGVSGFAALVHEIAWTRVLSMVLGPTIYSFAAALAAVIVGITVGSSLGTAIVARARRPAAWLACVLALAALAETWTSSLAGGPLPRLVAEQVAHAPNLFDELLRRGALLTVALILPVAALLGAAFPLALGMIDDAARSAAGRFGSVYAINTMGSVAGSLAAGFMLIPALGLEATLDVVTVCLIAAAGVLLAVAHIPPASRLAGAIVGAIAGAVMTLGPTWDRELLASGAYMYAPFVPKGADLEAMLKAGSLLYYREGASATVSVKRLTGTTTLAIDGKTDASNRGDMLTQKLVAHLPLLLHEQPHDVAIIGMGSGVTVGAALRHGIARADVLEISPEVVDASHYFREENRNALGDARTHLIVGDGRSHLQLSRRKYDVIISEPSNPWIAGVAALFTREFFATAAERLAPGGLICQWANAYNISDHDLRAIVATFLTVFPHGMAWLVGADDVVLIASDGPLDERLSNIARHWQRGGVADDLATVAVVEPFALLSLFVAGPSELRQFARQATVLTDDRMTLEFSGPRALGGRMVGENGATLRAQLDPQRAPAVIRQAGATAGAVEWRRRGAMMAARDAHSNALADFRRALELDPSDGEALDGFVRAAVLTRRAAEGLGWLKTVTPAEPTPRLLVALSKLLASTGSKVEALDYAMRAANVGADPELALEQVASLHAEAGANAELDAVVRRMRTAMPRHAATAYYEGALAFLRGDAQTALRAAREALQSDPSYAAAHDLVGAAHAKLGQTSEARAAFLASLAVDAHDSTAYANLGVLALNEGNAAAATDYFAEALWLDEGSTLARAGLAQSLRFQDAKVP